jgi:hypothetical protein
VLSYIVFALTKPRIISPDRHSSKFQPQFDPSNTSPRFAKNPLFLIQPVSFHSFPHSFAQWTTTNSFPFNLFHTLSIVMGGGGIPPSENLNRYFKYSPNDQIFCHPFFSTAYELPIFYPLCFDIHPSDGGCTPLAPFPTAPTARNDGCGSRFTDRASIRLPPVPLRRTSLGATMSDGATFLRLPGKQLRSPRCLRIVSGHRGRFNNKSPLQVVPGSIVLRKRAF